MQGVTALPKKPARKDPLKSAETRFGSEPIGWTMPAAETSAKTDVAREH